MQYNETLYTLNNIFYTLFIYAEGVIVKCSQTGRKIKTKVQNITKNDMSPIVIDDFKKGSSLLVEVNGKPYPVEFMAFMGMSLNFVKIYIRTY